VVKKWLQKVSEGEAYILVTPEYSRAPSAVLKNALDYLDFQFSKKPVALVGHGSTGGAQAIGTLRSILPQLKAVSTPQVVYFTHRVSETVSEDGQLNADLAANPHGPEAALKTLLEELKWYSDALGTAR
jgi:NAD(P)H-dependent FMN reductase